MPRPPGPHVRRPRYDADGVPIDPADWEVEDWRILNDGIAAIKVAIARRHRERREGEERIAKKYHESRGEVEGGR